MIFTHKLLPFTLELETRNTWLAEPREGRARKHLAIYIRIRNYPLNFLRSCSISWSSSLVRHPVFPTSLWFLNEVRSPLQWGRWCIQGTFLKMAEERQPNLRVLTLNCWYCTVDFTHFIFYWKYVLFISLSLQRDFVMHYESNCFRIRKNSWSSSYL